MSGTVHGVKIWTWLAASLFLGCEASDDGLRPEDPGPTSVSSVEIRPGSATMAVLDRRTFSVTATDSEGGSVSDFSARWSVTDAAVISTDQSGAVTAIGPGSAMIVAEVDAVADSAVVTVSEPLPSDPPPSSVTVFLRERFEDGALADRGWYDNPALTLTTAERREGSRALEMHFPAGAELPTFGGAARILFEDAETVYLAYWVKYSDNWVGSGQGFHPHEFQFLTNVDDPFVGPAFSHLTTYVEHNYQNGIIPVLGMQDASNIDQSRVGADLTGVTEDRAAAGCNGDGDRYATTCFPIGGQHRNGKSWYAEGPALTHGSPTHDVNDWHRVEAYFQLNSIQNGIGQPDGIARYWLDGELILDVTDVLFRTGQHPDMAFRTLVIGPYIGAGSPVAQTAWVDDLIVADRRP